MASASQFLSGAHKFRPVTVFAGPNHILRSLCITTLADILDARRTIRVSTPPHGFDLRPSSVAKLIETLVLEAPFQDDDSLLVIYGPLGRDSELSLLEKYSVMPLENVHLVCWAERTVRDRESHDKWLTGPVSTFTCVDCSPDQLVGLLASRLPGDDARWLASNSGFDLEESWRVADLMTYFESYDSDVLRMLAPPPMPASLLFRKFHIHGGGVESVYRQARRRLWQITMLALMWAGPKTRISDAAERVKDNPETTKALRELAETKPSYVWLDRLASVIRLGRYVEQHVPGVMAALEATLV